MNVVMRLTNCLSIVLTAVILAAWGPSVSVGAAEPEWQVGVARVKITPAKPVFLSGYASRNRPFTKIEADLYAKALVIQDSEGHRAALVTSDLLGFPAELAEPICERIRAKTGLHREQVLLTSAHVHTAPLLSLNALGRRPMTAADAARTVEYTKDLQGKVVELVARAAAHLQPARLSWGTGVVNFVMNRRQFTPQGVILGANPRGLADRSVPILRIDTPDGKLRAVVFGAAVHNTTLTQNNYELCGDYAGFAQENFEKEHPGAEALFVLGCAGDADPYPRGSMALARAHGATLAKEVNRVLETKLWPLRGPLTIAFGRVDLPLQKLSREDLRRLAARRRGIQPEMARQMLAQLDHGKNLPTHYRCPLTVWQFNGDLTLVGLSGEVVVDYVYLLEKALGPNPLWIAAYCNDVYGYLPSARVLKEGGYETRGLYAGGLGFFDAKAQGVLVRKVRELAAKAGRKLPSEK
jgi:hypothetical protein